MRHNCTRCNKRPARFKDSNGRYKRDKQHDLCRRCTTSLKNRVRAVRLVPNYG